MHRDWLLRPTAAGATATVATLAIVAASTALAGNGVEMPGVGAIALAAGAFALALWPEYAPRPRRWADRLAGAAVAAGLAVGGLAIVGSLGVAPAPDTPLLLAAGASVALVVPILAHRLRRVARSEHVLLAGDDAGRLGDSVAALESDPLGHVSPPRLSLASAAPESLDVDRLRTDGGVATGDDAVQPDPSSAPPETGGSASPSTERLSGLSGLQHVIESHDVDAVVLGYSVSDREEFFGALRICRELGVDAKVHEFHASATLLRTDAAGPKRGIEDERTGREAALQAARDAASDATGRGMETDGDGGGDGRPSDELEPDGGTQPDGDVHSDGGAPSDSGVRSNGGVHPDSGIQSDDSTQPDGGTNLDGSIQRVDGPVLDVDLEPLPLHARAAKRAFDVCFAVVGLLALSPLVLVICVAIKLDSPGPILYGQRRTTRLGRTFTLPKFRSMTDDAEDATGPTLSEEDAGEVDPRVTRVGRVLRITHLDEIPQLLSVLRGDMSVVGPRPERPELEAEISGDGLPWERRWFVKPGLTGLAQIEGLTAFQPARKLAYDLEYVARQSLLLDLRIVLAQLRLVVSDTLGLVGPGESE